jgi:hypothetical protein
LILISAADSGLSKSSAEIGGVIQGSQAQEIPLNGRNYVGLVALVPGAIDSGTGDIYNPDGTPSATSGLITSTTTPSRQIQFGVNGTF